MSKLEERFNQILPNTLKFEGGFTIDHAGPTNAGVTQTALDAYRKEKGLEPKDVKDINYGETKDLYFNDFYIKPGYDKLPQDTSAVLFDYGVNSGPGRSSKALQEIIGTKADGIVGPKTIKAVEEYIEKNGEQQLITGIINQRQEFLEGLIENNPQKYERFADGWANRLNELRELYQSSGDAITKE